MVVVVVAVELDVVEAVEVGLIVMSKIVVAELTCRIYS